MNIPEDQLLLASYIEQGLAYKAKGKEDQATENPKFWFHDLQDDQMVEEMNDNLKCVMKGYYVCVLGFGLIGKYGSPMNAKEVLKKIRYPVNKNSMILGLGISEQLFKIVNKLHQDKGLSAERIVNTLRTRLLVP